MADCETSEMEIDQSPESEKNKDQVEDAGSDSDSSSDNDNGEEERKVAELQKQISKNPYLYETHVELITLLKQLGELEQLRDARQRMNELFPLTEELWLDWLRDEIPLATDETERKTVEELFERAVKDYLSVNVWLEYVQFSIGGMAAQDGIIKIREAFEKALSSAGLHVAQGSSLWEAYREFENAILMGIMPAPGQVATKKQETDFEEQHKRIVNLFKRQLSVPLHDMEESFTEYKEWLQEEVDKQIKQLYQKALEKYNKIKPFEQDLLTKEDKQEVYKSYIEYEVSNGNAARVICLFERWLKEKCLEPEVWLKYTKYLDTTLKDESLSIPVFERSVRNCPWCSQLWSDYLLTLERSRKSHETIKDTVDRALAAGFSQGTEYLHVWTTYCDYLRRKIVWDSDHTESLSLFRANIEKAVEHLYSFPDSDPAGSLRQFWANIEAKFCKNVTKGRELWNDIMTEGHGNEASMWLSFYQFERCYGDNKHCRKVLQRALNSVSDWPEGIVNAFINFEREEGNLEQYEQTLAKCNAQMERITERRKLAEAKEEEQKSKQNKFNKKQHKTFEKGGNLGKDKKQFQNSVQKGDGQKQQQKKTNNSADNFPIKPYKKSERKTEEEKMDDSSTNSSNSSESLKRKREDGESSENQFKVPPPPGFKGRKSEPPPGFKDKKTEPPPGFKDKTADTSETPAKIPKTDESPHTGTGEEGQGDVTTKTSCTAFVSNLAYDVDEEKIEEVFSKLGDIVQIRLIKNYKGKSKGYAYVEYKDELCVMEALKLDRTPIEGRPVYISRCEEKSARKTQFKFATEMEKNKLFIKNLPFTCTKEALTNIFSQHGKLKDVRLVTYRSGAPKGLAYVEYEDEQTASQAVMKTDGLLIGDHAISVDISNPPERKMAKKDDDYIPSLGGGKKETELRGKARTQVTLMPRSVMTHTSVKPGKPTAKSDEKSDEKLASNDESTTSTSGGKSNSDFRKMLLGLK